MMEDNMRKRKYIYSMTRSPCCAAEINTTLNPLYPDKKKSTFKKNPKNKKILKKSHK